jgi:hypothetical protein
MAEEKMIVMVDLSGAEQTRQVLVLTDLSGTPVDLSGVKMSLVLPSEQVQEWAAPAAEAPVASATQESVNPAPAPADDKKEDTPQS